MSDLSIGQLQGAQGAQAKSDPLQKVNQNISAALKKAGGGDLSTAKPTEPESAMTKLHDYVFGGKTEDGQIRTAIGWQHPIKNPDGTFNKERVQEMVAKIERQSEYIAVGTGTLNLVNLGKGAMTTNGLLRFFRKPADDVGRGSNLTTKTASIIQEAIDTGRVKGINTPATELVNLQGVHRSLLSNLSKMTEKIQSNADEIVALGQRASSHLKNNPDQYIKTQTGSVRAGNAIHISHIPKTGTEAAQIAKQQLALREQASLIAEEARGLQGQIDEIGSAVKQMAEEIRFAGLSQADKLAESIPKITQEISSQHDVARIGKSAEDMVKQYEAALNPLRAQLTEAMKKLFIESPDKARAAIQKGMVIFSKSGTSREILSITEGKAVCETTRAGQRYTETINLSNLNLGENLKMIDFLR